MTRETSKEKAADWRVTALLVFSALISAGLGYAIGTWHAASAAFREELQDPLARLGYRMSMDEPDLPEGFPTLEDDLTAAQGRVVPPDGKMLRFLFELDRLGSPASVDVQAAKRQCEQMGWPRCDEAALRRMVELVRE